MRINEITETSGKKLYLMIDYVFQMKRIKKVASKRDIEILDDGKPNVFPMIFDIDPRSYQAQVFKDKLDVWGITYKDVTNLWSRKADVLKSIQQGDEDRVTKSYVNRSIERDFDADIDEDISKEVFHRKLADPAAQEIYDIVDELNSITRQHKFEAIIGKGSRFTTDKAPEDVAKIMSTLTVPMGEEVREGNIAQAIRSRVERTDHWVWDTWDGDAEDVMFCYMIRKT